ncbi:MAG: hypothetical protein QHC66_11390 [Pusillimonas sp.]|nr:hypothetical protein [Pusillimonas sp.]MDX3895315.1 hypothetical protein [Pusillimonas sp.]
MLPYELTSGNGNIGAQCRPQPMPKAADSISIVLRPDNSRPVAQTKPGEHNMTMIRPAINVHDIEPLTLQEPS